MVGNMGFQGRYIKLDKFFAKNIKGHNKIVEKTKYNTDFIVQEVIGFVTRDFVSNFVNLSANSIN